MNVIGYNMSKVCADKIFQQAGFQPGQGRDKVGVVELHDCFAANEVRESHNTVLQFQIVLIALQLLMYDALGLCPSGKAHEMVERGDNTVSSDEWPYSSFSDGNQYGGKYVINPSGGLEAKGHPLGATGLGMHFYITSEHHATLLYCVILSIHYLVSAIAGM